MGYNVEIDNADARIPGSKINEAFSRLKALNHKPGVEKRGGSWGPGGKTETWFSWMTSDYDKTATSAKEIFELLGFYTEDTEDGGVSLVGYDSKTGQEDLFLNEVKDLFEPGTFIDWRGEDGAHWRWTPEGTKQGTVVYE